MLQIVWALQAFVFSSEALSQVLAMSTLSAAFCFFLFQPFMGDNYCDSINNRAFCNYDGGDCCASTVKTKKVGMPLPLFDGNSLASAAFHLKEDIFC